MKDIIKKYGLVLLAFLSLSFFHQQTVYARETQNTKKTAYSFQNPDGIKTTKTGKAVDPFTPPESIVDCTMDMERKVSGLFDHEKEGLFEVVWTLKSTASNDAMQIERMGENGYYTDILSDYVLLYNPNPEEDYYGFKHGSPYYGSSDSIKAKVSFEDHDRSVKVSNLYIYPDQYLELTYYIELKEEYKDGNDYPAFKKSFLQYFDPEGQSVSVPLSSPTLRAVKPANSDPSVPKPSEPEKEEPSTPSTPSLDKDKKADTQKETESLEEETLILEEKTAADTQDTPSYNRNNIPDPNSPDSPEAIIVLDENGTPKVYTKITTEDNREIYVDEDGIPLIDAEIPKTKDMGISLIKILFFLLIVLFAINVRKRVSRI